MLLMLDNLYEDAGLLVVWSSTGKCCELSR
jgi:hypothetical protein